MGKLFYFDFVLGPKLIDEKSGSADGGKGVLTQGQGFEILAAVGSADNSELDSAVVELSQKIKGVAFEDVEDHAGEMFTEGQDAVKKLL